MNTDYKDLNLKLEKCYQKNKVMKLLNLLQKKTLCIITFSSLDHPSSPLYLSLEIIKLPDLIKPKVATFMYV